MIRASAPADSHDGAVNGEPPEHRDLHAFGPAARRALMAAEREALTFEHDRIGTEHLLLGLLAEKGSAAAQTLAAAGARLPLARRKVMESLPASPKAAQENAALELTTRAARALDRAQRFSYARRAELVTSVHLLMGVLHVEGTAGQVLRSLGVDVERLRVALDTDDRATGDDEGPRHRDLESGSVKPLLCPWCAAPVAEDLMYRVVRARSQHGYRDAGVFSCGACGTIIGTVPP